MPRPGGASCRGRGSRRPTIRARPSRCRPDTARSRPCPSRTASAGQVKTQPHHGTIRASNRSGSISGIRTQSGLAIARDPLPLVPGGGCGDPRGSLAAQRLCKLAFQAQWHKARASCSLRAWGPSLTAARPTASAIDRRPSSCDEKRVLRHSHAEELAPQRIFDRVARPIPRQVRREDQILAKLDVAVIGSRT